jgi:hypothetical protein
MIRFASGCLPLVLEQLVLINRAETAAAFRWS